jgi:hypothetical protein
MKYKIRIKTAPSMAYGGQTPNYALDMGQRQFTEYQQEDDHTQINNTLQEVPRYMANIEAEQGETALGDFNQDGNLEHMKIGGKRHSQGGTPLNVPEGTFIFSDTKKMRLGGQDLAMFGKSADTKKKYTPAQLAKQYDLQKYQAILDDPYADNISKRTAEMMIANNQKKLGQLALVQESKKGFPAGIPNIAMPLMQQGQGEQAMAYGGYVLPEALYGVNFVPPTDEYPGGKTAAGSITPTNVSNKFDRNQQFYNNWEALIPGFKKLNNKEAQRQAYQWMLANRPQDVNKMWQTYGLTNQGEKFQDLVAMTTKDPKTGKYTSRFDSSKPLTNDQLAKLERAYTDGMFGVRQMDPGAQPITPAPGPDPVPVPQPTPGPTPSGPKPTPVVKYKCGPNGVESVTVMGGWDQAAANKKTFGTFDPKATGPSMDYKPMGAPSGGAGLFDSYEAAFAACQGKPVEETPGTTPPDTPSAPGITPGDFNPGGNPVPFKYLTPDKLATLSAANNLLNVKKYMPWEAPITGYMADPTFLNPDRELAYNSEQARTQMDMNAMFAGPQSLGARNSAVQGSAAQNAANILGRINNQNVGIANEYSAQNAQMMNQLAQAQAARATRLFDKSTIANQQYDNSINAQRNELVKSGINAWNNRQKLNLMNNTNQFFYIDPTSGKFVQRTGLSLENSAPATTGASGDWKKYADTIAEIQAQYPNLDKAAIERIARMKMGLGNTTATNPNMGVKANGLGYLNAGMFGTPATGAFPDPD